jgi:hypothetical protein
LAKKFLHAEHCDLLFYNWDDRKVRDRYKDDNHFFAQDIYQVKSAGPKRWICMDEIHKYPGWKNVLKDFFDSHETNLRFIVTGSARLDMFRKSGDSLTGRYFLFHLNPLSLAEVLGKDGGYGFKMAGDEWVRQRLDRVEYHEEALSSLLEFGGFPEPFQKASTRFHNRWKIDYIDRIIREDLRDLTHIRELENIATLIKLLPDRISSPLSINALAEDLRTGFSTVSGYIHAMELGYLIFRIKPHAKSIARSISKESKVYFYDWTRIDDPARRFENFVAVALRTIADLWTDWGEGVFDLKYIRTRDGKETDFLVLKDEKPWLLVEVKMSRSGIDFHHYKNREIVGEKVPFVQVVRQSGVAENPQPYIYQISASRLFAQ